MKEYNYDPTYKHYISCNDAFISPLSAGEYLVSANATLLEPPKVESGKVQIFNENTKNWEIIDDFRGWYYNVFNGESLYNEIPSIKPRNYTNITPPDDYSPQKYIWDVDTNNWEKVNEIYKIKEDEVSKLSIQEKLNALNISPDELSELLGIKSANESIEKILELKNLEIKLNNIINSTMTGSLEEKFNVMNINLDYLKSMLGLSEMINYNEFLSLSMDDKFKKLFCVENIDHFKQLLDLGKGSLIEDILKKFSRTESELTELNYNVQHFRRMLSDAFSNIPSKYIYPVNFSESTVLRPLEILHTTEKFRCDDEVIPSGCIAICVDTGERRFGNSFHPWSELDTVPPNKKFRFYKTLEEWQDQNPIPGADIECYETDTDKIKVGNGFLPWDKLPYEAA